MSIIVILSLAVAIGTVMETMRKCNQKRKLFAMQLHFERKRHTSQRRLKGNGNSYCYNI